MLPENRRRARPRSVVRPAANLERYDPAAAVRQSQRTDPHRRKPFAQYRRNVRTHRPAAEIVEQGSSFKFCLLAEGTVEIYVRTSNTYEWDTAAGEIILSEAGGVVEPFDGGAGLQYNKISLHNPHFVCRSKYFR